MPIRFSSLRFRLILLVLLSLLPAFVIVVYTNLDERRQALDRANTDALRLARLAADRQDSLVESTRQFLATLAQVPDIHTGSLEDCAAFFAQLLKSNPSYTGFTLTAPTGTIMCSAPPADPTINLTDRAWFVRTLQSHDLVVGDYQIGRISGKPAVIFAYPVLDNAENVQSVLTAGMDLSWLNEFITAVELPPGTALIVVDSNGTILARYPDPQIWVGKTMPEAAIIKSILTGQKEGTSEVPGVDGIPRLYAFTTLSQIADTGAYVSVGIPTSVAFAAANETLTRSLSLLGLGALLALAAAWVSSDLFILRRVNGLLQATRRLAAGELHTRTAIPGDAGELSELAHAFDDMAQQIEQREDRIMRQNTELMTLYAIGQATAQSLELDDVLQNSLRQVCESLHMDAGVIYLLGPDNRTLVAKLQRGFSAEYMERVGRLDVGEGAAGRAVIDRRPVVATSENYPTPRLNPVLADEQIKTIVSAPLLSRGNVVGAYSVASHDARTFLAEEMALLTAIGQQLGIAVENAELYTQVRKELAERERAERALQVYAGKLEQSNRDLQDFAYLSSHDLQEPLRKIQAFGDRLTQRYGDALEADGRDYLERMRSAAERMQKLINALLDYSRVKTKAQPFVTTDLNRVVRDTLTDLDERLRETGGSVEVGLLPTIEADPLQLQQLFQNLIANALKFHRPDVPPLVKVSGSIQKVSRENGRTLECCEIRVEDNGIGFEGKYASRIFQPFQRLHSREEYEGTGIGLAICRKIAERHGGTITVHSQPGVGTTFLVTLDLRPSQSVGGAE